MRAQHHLEREHQPRHLTTTRHVRQWSRIHTRIQLNHKRDLLRPGLSHSIESPKRYGETSVGHSQSRQQLLYRRAELTGGLFAHGGERPSSGNELFLCRLPIGCELFQVHVGRIEYIQLRRRIIACLQHGFDCLTVFLHEPVQDIASPFDVGQSARIGLDFSGVLPRGYRARARSHYVDARFVRLDSEVPGGLSSLTRKALAAVGASYSMIRM